MTTIGGPVMSRDAFIEFGSAWEKILESYRIFEPFHMTDFVRPHGKYIGIGYEMKLALFRELATTINDHKLYSLSVSVSGEEFDSEFPGDIRHTLIGPYGVAFFTAVLTNQSFSEHNLFYAAERIAYLIDVGFPHADQLHAVHRVIVENYRGAGIPCFVGAMAEDSDANVAALQAADLIAWASRRRELHTLTEEFAPLHWAIRKDCCHAHVPLPIGGLKMFSNPVKNWLKTGVLPKLEEIIRLDK